MGRLGQVVEDKQCIQLKDLTTVSHGHAEPRESEEGTFVQAPVSLEWDSLEMGRQDPDLVATCPRHSRLQSVVRAEEEGHCPSLLFLHLYRMM